MAADITSFGAVGDGVTDSTAAIQAALDSGAGEVFIPDGVFGLSNVSIRAPLRLFGPGTFRVLPETRGTAFDVRADDVRLEGCGIDGNKANQSARGQRIFEPAGKRFSAVGMEIFNCFAKVFVTGLQSEGHTYDRLQLHHNGATGNCNAFSFRGRNHIATKCIVRDHGDGHAFRFGRFGSDAELPVENFTVSDCIVEDSDHNAFTFELGTRYVVLKGNIARNVPQALKADGGASYISVVGNLFENITCDTAFNLRKADYLVFAGNVSRNVAGGLNFGEAGIISDNIFEDVPASFDEGVVRIEGSRGVISGNNIRGAIIQGIRTGTGSAAAACRILQNYVESTSRITSNIGMNIPGAEPIIQGNRIKGFAKGIRLTRQATDGIVSGNNLRGNTTPFEGPPATIFANNLT